MKKYNSFIWETHGIHAGTEKDHVKHGIDELENIVDLAIESGHPSITFIIHSPRLTKFRYQAEIDTSVKFIRGNKSYQNYPNRIEQLRKKYQDKINIKYGVELEWLGPEIGLNWNRSKIFQAQDADFVIGSVHFAPEGLPYDGSKQEAEKLLKMRGSLENYWDGYLNEVIQMIEMMGDMIQVVGHLDLPKLNVDVPDAIANLATSKHPLSLKLRTVLEMIADRNLALDVDMAGEVKGVGVYPSLNILEKAKQLGISVALGTDTHHIKHYGLNFKESLEYIHKAGYQQYVSYSKLIPETRTIFEDHDLKVRFTVLNKGIEIINQRFSEERRRVIPKFSFGGKFCEFKNIYNGSSTMGEFDAIKIRRGDKSVTVSDCLPENYTQKASGLYSLHKDAPGVLSSIFNALASEGINVETAKLKSRHDGSAEAYLNLSGDQNNIKEAIEFIQGTDKETFIEINHIENLEIPRLNGGSRYLLAMDGVDLYLELTEQIILTKHLNKPGVLLILLSALASKGINVIDLALGKRNDFGYSALAVDGPKDVIEDLLKRLGPDYSEASLIIFKSQ